MTQGYTLTWRSRGAAGFPGLPLTDGAVLRPDTLGALSREALAGTTLRLGRTQPGVGELFDLAGEPGDTLTLRGMPATPRLGALMERGTLVIEGDAGDDVGASMRGGTIIVTGSAGRRVGGPDFTSHRGMTGGTIVVRGEVGDLAGLRMRRGLIVVQGASGKSPGYRMLAGTIALLGAVGDGPGLEMRRGTILCLAPHSATNLGPHLAESGTFDTLQLPALRLVLLRLRGLGCAIDHALAGRFRGLRGDVHELGKGELWQWCS